MEARVKFRHETLHQKGTVGRILLWLQEDPNRGRNTNINISHKEVKEWHKQYTLVIAKRY